MSKPREPWWPYVKNVIRKYPAYKAELKLLKNQKITPGYSKTSGRGKTQRKTEAIALRQLPPGDQVRFEAVERAIIITKAMPDGKWRYKLIEQYYFQKHVARLSDIAFSCNISEATAWRWHADFVRLVAEQLERRGALIR